MSADLTREQVKNWIANATAPGPVLALNSGAAFRLGESWLRLVDRAERAEAERDAARTDVESATLLRSNAMSAVADRNEALRAIFDAADGWKITLDPGPTIDAIDAARALVAGAAL